MFLSRITRKAFAKTRSVSMPPPTGGWNARDTLSNMEADQAIVLDNYFPDATEVKLRRGEVEHKTGMAGNVDSLLIYSPLSGTQAMFAANNGSIYNATSAGEIGVAVKSGFTGNQWQFINFGTAGGQFLFCVNGADTPQLYDGATFEDTTLTGPTVANLAWCNAHQRRIWTGEKSSLSAWYGAVNAITGAFTEFPLAGVATLGGYVMGMATWTRDGGSGPDDVAVFVTSEGEAILYSGIDPADSATWSLVGVFRIGKPLGRRFYTKAGSDIILMTEDGFVVGSQILQLDRSQAQRGAISDQINKAVNQAVRTARNNFGWAPILYPAGNMLLFNIPVSSSKSHQYVFNTLTKAPCRFTGWNARCFAICNDALYYGGTDGKVHKADYGESDSSTYIYGDIFPSFNYFKASGLSKKFNLCKPVFGGGAEISPALYLMTDFKIPDYETPPTAVDFGDASVFGTAIWGTGVFGGENNIYQKWRSVNGIGRAASLRILTATNNASPSLQAINYIYQLGGFMG
jgi:hypothetical protein